MRLLLLLGIQLYWRIVPLARRRKCLFAKSCSHHVYDIARREGLRPGVRALRERMRTCRSGYRLLSTVDADGTPLVGLASGAVMRIDEMSYIVRAQFGRV